MPGRVVREGEVEWCWWEVGAHEVDREQQAPQLVPEPVGVGAGLGERSVLPFVVDGAVRAPIRPPVLVDRWPDGAARRLGREGQDRAPVLPLNPSLEFLLVEEVVVVP